ncbi:MAG: acyl-CoA/acyl-ACP dehydrogenase [Firmicutes bacterium]|nr:acyl-CoA/acyl-ACP dehydrogenase [Bacillota bacterium]
MEKAEDEDLSLARSLEEWANAEVMGKRLELKENIEKLLKPAMRKLYLDIEMQKLVWEEEDGGAGHNSPKIAPTLALALEQIGRADTGIGFVTASTFALYSTFAFQSTLNELLCKKHASLCCQDDQVVFGSLILPAYGREERESEHFNFRGKCLQASARKEGDRWIISGNAIRPLNSGADASIFGILCAVEGDEKEEPAFFIVPADQAGIKRGQPFLKTGLAASVNADVDFEEVEVENENLVFRGEAPYYRMLSWLYMGAGAVTVGSLLSAFEIIKEWGDTRVIKGRGCIFKENPLTASLMAEIGHQILLSRLLIHQLANLLAQPDETRYTTDESLFATALSIFAHVSGVAEKSINNIMELMGSAGYATEWNLERYWRDVKTIQVHLGNWELLKMDLARYFYDCKTL